MDFIQESWPHLIVGLLIFIALIFIVRTGRQSRGNRPLSKINPLEWLRSIRRFYLSSIAVRRWTINILGAVMVLWFASFYINWIQPALTPADLFPPEFTGPVAVKAWKAHQGPVVNVATYTGRIEPYLSNDVYARVDGFVEKMDVYEGDFVEEGQVLAQLDISNLRPQLMKAIADSTFLQAEMVRTTQLYEDSVIPPSEFDRVKKMYQQTVAQVELMRTNVEYATIRSGISGFVAERHIYPGQYVKRGQKMFRVDQLDSVRIKFTVSEEDLVFIQQGDPVLLEFPQFSPFVFEHNSEWRNRIELLSEDDQSTIWMNNKVSKHALSGGYPIQATGAPSILAEDAVVFPAEDPITRTGTVEVRLSNPGILLKSNGYVVGKFAVARVDTAVRVPSKAIVHTPDGKSMVYIAPALTEQGFAEARDVITGLISPDYTQIFSGVEPGEYVVYSGMKNLVHGQDVLVLDRKE